MQRKVNSKKMGFVSPQHQAQPIGHYQLGVKTKKNSKSRNRLTPGKRERLLRVLTKEKAKDSLVLKYLSDRIKNKQNGFDVQELELLQSEIKKIFPQANEKEILKQLQENKENKDNKDNKDNKENQENKENEMNNIKNQNDISQLNNGQLKEKWRKEKQAKTLNINEDEMTPKSIYEMGDDQDEYDLIVKYNTEQYKRNLQQKFIEKKKQQQILGESYSQQIEHKKLQKQLEDLQSKRIKEQFDKDVLKYKQEQLQFKLQEKQKIQQQSNMIKESLENYNQKKKLQNSLLFNEGKNYQGQASRAVEEEKEERRLKKLYERQFYKQLQDLTEEEKTKAHQRKLQEKEEDKKLFSDRVQQFNRMDELRYKDKEIAHQKANIIENIISPSAESHFSSKSQRIANQELLSLKQAYVLDEQEKQKEYERKHREQELQKQINSILDLQIKQREAQKQQAKCEDIEQSNIFRSNDREYLAQQNQINKSIKQMNQQHALELRKQIDADREKKQAEKFMSINEIIYNKDLLKNASREVSDYSRNITKRDLMLPKLQKSIYHSNLY